MAISALSVQDIYGPRTGTSASVSRRATPGATRQTQDAARRREAGQDVPDALKRAQAISAVSKPLFGAIILGLFLVALRFVADKTGGPSELQAIKINPYNAVVIALTATLGLFILKVFFSLVPVPHVTPVVLAA